jgi:L-fuconolactonase
LETFGKDRLVWGGDWPVVNLGTGLAKWCQISEQLLSHLHASEQDAIFRTNAIRIYGVKEEGKPET